jgi:hypothetical protein
MITTNKSIALWYEGGGLSKMKIEAVFTVFKLISIFGVSSVPFWLQFHKDHYDISDVTFQLDWGWAWGYYLITYSVMSYFIARPLFKKVDDIIQNEEYFRRVALNIDSTETVSLNDVINSIEVEKDEFLVEAISDDNFLISLEDKGYLVINAPIFKNLLSSRPFEIALKTILKFYYIDSNQWTFANAHQNSEKFKALSKKMGWVIIPFIPALIIFSTINHVLTYINNREYLSINTFNRYGIWKFRYYNEFLTHTKKRIERTNKAANSIIADLFLENWKSSFSKGLSFLFSLFTLFLIIFSFNGYERLWGADIIALIALFAGLSTILFPCKKEVEGRMSILQSILKSDMTRSEVSNYFESKLAILGKEILAILFLPIIFFWVIPDKAYCIAIFMSSYNKDGICTFAKWENKDQTNKTKKSYEHVSQDLSGCIIDL